MYYEIAEIEPGEGPNDVLVEVHYWHGNKKRPQRAPDFVEHHLILGLHREGLGVAQEDALGWYVLADGTIVSPYELVDDVWTKRTVYELGIQDQVAWSVTPDEHLAKMVEADVDHSAQRISETGRKGTDKFSDVERPIEQTKFKKAAARRLEVQALRGRKKTL